jgi:very-short-patch-repair endonuclease
MKKLTKKEKSDFSKKLELNTPRSEIWFRSLYFRHYSILSDIYNKPYAGYIPDIRNKEYKYIIEVDGSIHKLKRIQTKDKKKTAIYNKLGYQVIRIKAYDYQSYINAINELIKIRGKVSKPTFEYNNFLKNFLEDI